MSEIMEKAKDKIYGELNTFREETQKLNAEDIYNRAGMIMFTETMVYHLGCLIKGSDELCSLVIKDGKSIKDAVRYVAQKATWENAKVEDKNAKMGDLPIERFYELIWEYYKIEPAKAKAAKENAKVLEEREKKIREDIAKAKRKNAIAAAKTSASSKSKVKPGPMQMQLSLFQ